MVVRVETDVETGVRYAPNSVAEARQRFQASIMDLKRAFKGLDSGLVKETYRSLAGTIRETTQYLDNKDMVNRRVQPRGD